MTKKDAIQDPVQRAANKQVLIRQLELGEITLGQAIRRMRKEWAGLNQTRLARICKVSVNTLSAVERDEGNATIDTLGQILAPFGMEVSARPKIRSGN